MKRRGRQLSPEERDLWNKVARTVAPLAPAPPVVPETAPARPVIAPTGGKPEQAPPAPPTPPRRSPLEAGDPKRERQVARGRLAIEGVLDLHGMRQDEADRATLNFLASSVRRGRRVVLVITGKGSADSSAEGRGVLRRRFLQGIEAGLYGSSITSVRPAHQRHGGSGAFYVFLKARRTRTAGEDVTKASRRTSMRPR